MSQEAVKPQKIDREAVKTLAIAVGVRQAARELGLNEDTVCSWAKREKWFTVEAKPQPPSQAIIPQALQAKPSDALASILSDENRETKLSLSRGVRRLAKHIENLPAEMLFVGADKVKQAVASASQIHGWEESKGTAGPTLNILQIGGEMQIND
jgi:Putative ATPase subunit of terminase (gpP-like)